MTFVSHVLALLMLVFGGQPPVSNSDSGCHMDPLGSCSASDTDMGPHWDPPASSVSCPWRRNVRTIPRSGTAVCAMDGFPRKKAALSAASHLRVAGDRQFGTLRRITASVVRTVNRIFPGGCDEETEIRRGIPMRWPPPGARVHASARGPDPDGPRRRTRGGMPHVRRGKKRPGEAPAGR